MALRRRRLTLPVVLSTLVIAAASCGGGEESATPGAAEAEGKEPVEIAFLNISSANTWTLKSREAMERVAAERGATLTEFDAEFSADKQSQQVQDVIASGKYQGIVINPMGAPLMRDVEAAIDAGLKVVVQGSILGDRLDTAEPQVDGLSASISAVPLDYGERWGKLTLQACEGKDPCRVVYFFGIKGGPHDVAYRQGFDSVTSANPAIRVVAEAEGGFLAGDVGYQKMQDILQSTPDFDVVIGPDQPMQGIERALQEVGKLDRVALIGFGGSSYCIDALNAGKWFGCIVTVPQTEGELAMNTLLDAIERGKECKCGIDPFKGRVPGEGMITAENVDEFEAQWVG